MPDTLNIPNRAPTLYVIFTAEINPTTVERLTGVMVQAAKRNVEEVYLAMSTPGGQIQSGITLYNTLLAMPFPLKVHNVGNVDSIGNVVFLAGQSRYATSTATFMFHGVGFDVKGPLRLEEQFLRDHLDSLLSDQLRMGKIIASRSSLKDDEIAKLFRTQRTVDSTWAKDNGMIEDVRDFSIPPGSPIVSLVFER